MMPWRQEPNAKAVHKISEKMGHSPRSQPALLDLPCPAPASSIHMFRLVLSISFPTNTQQCCIFLRRLVEVVGFGVVATTSSI